MGSAEGAVEVHGSRLRALMERLVDTPVRAFLYEAAGSADDRLLGQGAALVRQAGDTWRIPVEIVEVSPSDHGAWLEGMTSAVDRLLTVG
jgi:hypothetical protein